MFWPVVLPFQITCVVLLVAVVVLTLFASPKAWSRTKAFCIFSGISLVAFIPSCSALERGAFLDEGKPVDPDSFKMTFGDLGWDSPSDAIAYYSPCERDGGGATYYVDSGSDVIFQRTGFW